MLCCLTGAGASGVTLVASTSQVCLSHLSFLCRLPPLPCPPEHYHPLEQPKGPKGLRTSRIHLTPFNVFHLWRCWHLRCVPDPSSLSHSASLFYPPSCIWQVANMAKNMFTKKQGFSEGSSICSTTLPATPSARLRGAGHIQHQHDERKSMMQGPLLLQIFIVPLKDLLTQFNSCHQCMWNFWMHTMKMRINKSRRQEPIAV